MNAREASEKVATVLRDAAHAIRQVTRERDVLAEKVAHIERRQEAIKVAEAMQEKGVNTDRAHDDLVAELEKAATEGRLSTIREAVELVGPDMTRSVSLDDRDHSTGNALEQYLMGDG